MGDVGEPLFHYFTVQLHLLCVWGGGVKFPLLHFGFPTLELTMQDSHPSLYYSIKTLYHFCISDLF